MCSLSFSDIKPQIYNYLGFKGVQPSPETDELIRSCFAEVEQTVQFNYLYKAYTAPPEFLQKQPYADFLSGTTGVILAAVTIGAEIDRKIHRLTRTDMTRGVVFDACSSAYLEARADQYEKTIADNLTYRFCPGYGGSSTDDLKHIFRLLRPEKIGMTLNESNFMLPSKSMAGIIGIGKSVKKTCEDCIMRPACRYREEGKRCYSLEKTL